MQEVPAAVQPISMVTVTPPVTGAVPTVHVIVGAPPAEVPVIANAHVDAPEEKFAVILLVYYHVSNFRIL